MKVSLILVLIIAGAVSFAANPTDEILSRLETALAKEAKDREAAHQGVTDYSNVIAHIQMSVDSERWQDASMHLNAILESKHSPEVSKISRELRGQLLLEVANREDQVVNRINDAVKKAGETCLDAKDQKQLDPILRELSDLRPAEQTFRPERVRAAYSKLDVALSFVTRWQDYLAKKASGKDQEANAIIQQLADHNNVYPIVPRSELLARITNPASPAATPAPRVTLKQLVADTKSLDDLDKLLAALHELERDKATAEEARALASQVSALRTAYADLRAGRYGPAFQLYLGCVRTSFVNSDYLAPLQQQLLAKLLPHYLNTAEVPEPAPNESSSDFLLRLVKEAKQKQDWDLALRALQTFKTVAYQNATEPAWLSADISGYSALVVAQKEEKAMQFSEAIAAYQKALECNGQNLPVEIISERLATLRKQHPATPK